MTDKNKEKLNKNQIFDSFKQELNNFKNALEKSESNESLNVKDYETNFYNWLVDLKNKVDADDKQEFDEILNKLKNHEVTSEDLTKLWEILVKLETKDISQAELEKMKNSVLESKKIKWELTKLKSNISDPEKKIELEIKEKIKKYKKRILTLSDEHPIWIKAMILLLPKKLQSFFVEKESSNESDWFLWWLKEVISEITWFLAQIAAVFFSWFAPKEIKDLLNDIKTDFSDISDDLLNKLWVWSFSDVAKKIKKEISPEKLEEWKKQLLTYMKKKWAEWFWITSDKEKKYEKALNIWWNRISKDKQVDKFIEKIVTWEVNLQDLSLEDILSWLWAGLKVWIHLVWALYDEWIISLEQIWLKILKKWWEIFVQTAMFFPKAIYTFLGWWTLEDLYKYIKDGEFSDINKDIFLVMIYRAINTPPFSILQHIAALPGYALSAVANMWQTYTKWKIFFEALNWGIDTQLKLLSEIEQKITNREWKIYEWIRESLEYYKKWLIVSYAYGTSKNYDEFLKIIKEAGLENDPNVRTLLENLKNDYDVTKITGFIDSMKAEINSFWTSTKYASSTAIVEKIKQEVGWIFGHTNFFKETISKLSESLEKNANILKQWEILNVVERVIKKAKYAKIAGSSVDLLDLSHLTWGINSLKDFGNDLKILAKHSPDLLKFIFRNTPVVLIGADMMKNIKKDWVAEWLFKTYASLVPIVGPIVFVTDEMKNDKFSLEDLWITGIWLGLDIWYVVKTKPGNIVKLVTMPAVDTVKFIWTATDIIWRYTLDGTKLAKEVKISKWGKFWFAVAALAAMIWIVVKFSNDGEDSQSFKILKDLANKSPGQVNEEIVKNWNSWSDNLKEQLLTSVIFYYMWFDPDSMWKILEDIEFKWKEYTLKIKDKFKKDPYVEDKLAEIQPVISQMEHKLWIKINIV